MVSFTIILQVYNSPLTLVVTPIALLPYSFLVKTVSGQNPAMIIKRLPNQSWTAEMVKMKFFTKKNIQRLGKLIETKNEQLFTLSKPT